MKILIRKPKNEKTCTKGKCKKEINPKWHPGIYFGIPFLYDENDYACYMCRRKE